MPNCWLLEAVHLQLAVRDLHLAPVRLVAARAVAVEAAVAGDAHGLLVLLARKTRHSAMWERSDEQIETMSFCARIDSLGSMPVKLLLIRKHA